MTDIPSEQQALNDAVLYALKCGCFFPVPQLNGHMTVQEMIQWGAMRRLHTAIAAFFRQPHERQRADEWTPSVKPDPSPSPQHAPRGGGKW